MLSLSTEWCSYTMMKILFTIIESMIRNVGGGLGQKIRYYYYLNRFDSCGKNVRIDIGVLFENIENIEVGNNVWIMPYSIITARPKKLTIVNRVIKYVKNKDYIFDDYKLRIGSNIQIGIGCIINGYGGIHINDNVTLSAGVKMYSFSHYPCNEEDRSIVTYANSMVKNLPVSCIESPIILNDGVWLGLDVKVLGGTIGKNTFVKPNSVVFKSIQENSYAEGNPAIRIKERFDY